MAAFLACTLAMMFMYLQRVIYLAYPHSGVWRHYLSHH